MNSPHVNLPPPPRGHAGPVPLRRPHSVRRTSSIDVIWPEGYGKAMHFDARCRDAVTGPDAKAAPMTLSLDEFNAVFASDRTIQSIAATPPRSGIEGLVGLNGGGKFRSVLDEVLPEERRRGTPLYLLLDDIPGASLVAPIAWTHWRTNWPPTKQSAANEEAARAQRKARFADICAGYRPGSSALDDIYYINQRNRAVGPLINPQDPYGWHELPEHKAMAMRRARCIDVWRDELIHIDTLFQDSATTPAGGRVAVHEYLLKATADPVTLQLLSVEAIPCILPYPECPAAVDNINRLLGTPLDNLRKTVLRVLHHTLGCTHLNDTFRALAEVPILCAALPGSTEP